MFCLALCVDMGVRSIALLQCVDSAKVLNSLSQNAANNECPSLQAVLLSMHAHPTHALTAMLLPCNLVYSITIQRTACSSS